MKRILNTLLLALFLSSMWQGAAAGQQIISGISILQGPGGSGGGGGTITGSGSTNKLTVWNSLSVISERDLVAPSAVGNVQELHTTSGTSLTIRPGTGTDNGETIKLQSADGVDQLEITTSTVVIHRDLAVAPIAAPAAHPTRDTLFKDSADGNFKIRKAVTDGGGILTIEPPLFTEDEYTPTIGQTVFTLTGSWVGGSGFVSVEVNGIGYDRGSHYTASVGSITWLDVPFTLEITDRFTVMYQTQ